MVMQMNDWTRKLEDEDRLTAAEVAELDSALESDEQRLVAAEMSALKPMDTPAGLVAAFERRVVRAGRLRLATAFGAGAAACLAVVAALYQPAPREIPVANATGESLYDWHYEAVATSILPGDGANLAGFSQVAREETQAR